MKRVAILLVFIILMTSLASAELIFTQQPEDLYNLGELIRIPIKIATTEGVANFFSMELICNGIKTEVHKQYIFLSLGEEQEINAAIPLITNFIGRSTGVCSIKAILGEQYTLTKELTISDRINANAEIEKQDFNPEEPIIIKGNAVKENGENVKGFADLDLIRKGESILKITDTVKNGYIFLNVSAPKDAKAGEYIALLNIYEKESDGNISNKGTASVSLLINQVPTSLEINLEKPVEPGNNLKVTAILHDQTGEKIISDAVITIKNEKSKIIEQRDVQTDELIEIPVAYNQPPNEWIIIIKSEGLSTEEKFNISQKEAVKINVINSTVIITNIGNVVYNKTTIVKIGNNTINLDICLPIDGVQKYYLSAPDGEYDLEIRAGDEKLNERVMLTGNAVAVEKISDGIISRIAYPLVWMFIIGVLGLVAYLIYKKGYKKAFFGYITKKREERQQATKTTDKSLISTKNKAELSLSIKGEQQNISIACIKLKNETELVKNDAVKEKLNEITRIAEDSKASVYENQNNIFYMWVPLNTKTFKNQNTAIEISQKIKESLDKYNKLAKQKIDFGISLNYGTIVAKKEKDVLKFMSMGTLITTAKKIASISQGEILLSEKMNDKVVVEVKTEKHEKDKIPVYSIKEVRQRGEDTKKFISDFIKRLESDKKAKEK